MKRLRIGTIALIYGLLLLFSPFAQAADRFITVASTTSTANSGLFEHVLPLFTDRTGIAVRIVAVGTGQAIRLARNGDADVLFVHHTPSEEKFIAEGFGAVRHDVMYNDFVVVGPKADPSGVGRAANLRAALGAIASGGAPFASRGDDSGTHKREQDLWRDAAIKPDGAWYRETGSGMGATLNTAAAMGAYTLTDRATWLAFQNKADLTILFQGDARLFNQYGIIPISEDRFPHVKSAAAAAFVAWILSPEGQGAIAAYRRAGQQLFFPNADR